MAHSVNQLHTFSGALLRYMQETATVLGRLPEGAPLRETFRNDVHDLIAELEGVLDAMDGEGS